MTCRVGEYTITHFAKWRPWRSYWTLAELEVG